MNTLSYLKNLINFPHSRWMFSTSHKVIMTGVVGVVGAPENYQVSFQLPCSPIAEGIFTFHDDLMSFLIGILFFVFSIMISAISMGEKGSNSNKIFSSVRVVHASTLEIIWTILPALFLVVIAIPSFSLLYSIDEIIEPMLSFKVIGHQWYWSYEFFNPKLFSKLYNDVKNQVLTAPSEDNSSFDSYMLAMDDSPEDLAYMNKLSVDNHLYLPINTQSRAMITSTDVLHCWAVPSLGVKLDACPGRLNQMGLFIKRAGFYYGQCSEICGVNHGFMPIGIVGVDFSVVGDENAMDFDPLISVLSMENEKLTNLTSTYSRFMS